MSDAKRKNIKHKIKGSIMTTIGYTLSPVSWWNDLLINIPLAYAFAFPFALINKRLFLPMMIIGYWITNVIGFMLMHYGITDVISGKKSVYTKKAFIKDTIISIIYTLVVVFFASMGWIKFPLEYFAN